MKENALLYVAALVLGFVGFVYAMRKKDESRQPKSIQPSTVLTAYPSVARRIVQKLDKLSDESLLKMIRQLEFWHTENALPESELLLLTDRLLHAATLVHTGFQVPKVRFGKTELQMPILTAGAMRIQYTYFPDDNFMSHNRSRILKGDSQRNLKATVKACLKMGINHFETARFYGTSEYQLAHALKELIDEGFMKREDFILQTKIIPLDSRAPFEDRWNKSWAIFERLGYIDLLAIHCVSKSESVEDTLSDKDDGIMAFVKELQSQGKIRHIGFSTHGTAKNILKLINSEKFSFVNLHAHYFGDYHAQGTPDMLGGHGNKAAIRRALELDMGVFCISPLDKGGALYRPSAVVAQTLGPRTTPIAFAALHNWKTQQFHTMSVGFSGPADLEELLEAAYVHKNGGYEEELEVSEERLNRRMIETLGKDWVDRGLLNLPDCEEESTSGVAIGHILWLHNVVKAFGMHFFASRRYENLESVKWDNKKSFDENMKGISNGNMGRAYIPTVDYTKALEKHYNPQLVESKLAELDSWLGKTNAISDETELRKRGWNTAYDLSCWEDFPGGNPSLKSILLQLLPGGFGCGGPTPAFGRSVASVRQALMSNA